MQFWLFRVSLLETAQDQLFASTLTHEERLERLVQSLTDPSLTPIEYKGLEYNFYNSEVVDNRLVIGRVARPDTVTRTLPDSGDPSRLVEVEEESRAWAHFLFGMLREQIIAVQLKREFFSGTAEGLAEILRSLLIRSFDGTRYEVAVFPLSEKSEFWSIVSEAEQLFSVEFEFVMPNMFGGRQLLANLLNEEKAEHNATQFSSKIANPSGALKFPQNEKTEAETSYAAAGGGSWHIEAKTRNGERRFFHSHTEAPAIVSIVDDDQAAHTISHRWREIARKVIRELKKFVRRS